MFTSVLATAVVPGILSAVQATSGQRIFVANVANERGMARGFGLAEHLEAMLDHGVAIDVVVANEGTPCVGLTGVEVRSADLAADDGWGHDPVRLGAVLREIHEER